jgi:diguanylate cyclase (GGDEF)-like protein
MKQALTRKASGIVLGLMALFIAVVVAITAVLVLERRSLDQDDSVAQAVRFVGGAEAAINRNLLGVDVLLASTDNLLGLSTMQREWIGAGTSGKLIQNTMRQNLLIGRIAVVDESGKTLASSDPTEVDQQTNLPATYLAEVLAQPVSTLVISAPAVSFRSSEAVLFMGRHIKLADGSRIVVVAEVAIPQLRAILVQGADIPGLEATIERGNGELLVAAPAQSDGSLKLLSPPLNSGTGWEQPLGKLSRLSAAPAIVVVRNTLYSGIFITASIPLDAALTNAHRESWLIGGAAAALMLVILGAGAFAMWYLNRMAEAQRTISKAKETLDQALESMVSGFVLLDVNQHVLNWNRRYLELHPWLRNAMVPGMPFLTCVQMTADTFMRAATEAERAEWVAHRMALLNGPFEGREQTTPDGTRLEIVERPTADGGTVIVYQDVTRLHGAMADVERLAFYDPLTGLPNRRLLNDRLQQGINATVRTARHGALLFLDLDHFKTLNDTSGHNMGDLLLQQVAQRLKACVREEDTVARLGGDEFVVMLQNLSVEPLEAAGQAQKVGETILESLTKPYQLLDIEHRSTCSVGATLFGKTHQDSAELLKQADIAMYQVKNAGRNALCFFDPAMLSAITSRAEMERDLRQALEQRQLILHYQVQVQKHGRPVGAEVLIRWQHPERGMVPPGQFIGLAEDTGLIIPIGAWVLRTACLQLKAWEKVAAAADLQLAVNVSARQFRGVDFVQTVRDIVLETGINPQLLKLELTESVVLDSINDTIDKMQTLKALGVRFSMDDFGTGYSSLAYLTRLPLDQLKIDQSFVRNIGMLTADSAVIDSIIGLARSLDLEVIAEGVETAIQRDFLAEHGCEMYQGYFFGKPIPVAALEDWLVSNRIAQ